jgi:hypothetical protein
MRKEKLKEILAIPSYAWWDIINSAHMAEVG